MQTHTVFSSQVGAHVRAALAMGAPALAERLAAGIVTTTPYDLHAAVAAKASIAEAGGDLETALEGYADAAQRWERFGVVPEQAFSLLGRGRCLLALGRPTEASPVLLEARLTFDRLAATPTLREVDALLELATARSS
jgi:hypothetical protein